MFSNFSRVMSGLARTRCACTKAGALTTARYHLVVTIPWNSTLAHIYLDPKLPFRNRIIAAIQLAAKEA